MRRFLFSICFLFSASACAEEERDWRTYDGVFDGFDLMPEQIEWVKKLDRWVFRSPQDVFVSPAQISHPADYVSSRQNVGYAGSVDREMVWASPNDGELQDIFFQSLLNVSYDPAEADVLVLGVHSFTGLDDSELLKSAEGFVFPLTGEGVFLDKIEQSGLDCFLYRSRMGPRVQKTLIVVSSSGLLTDSTKVSRKIACINKGHYFHFGFSNVDNIPNESFSKYSSVIKSYSMDTGTYLRILPPLISGKLIGLGRDKFLREFIKQQQDYVQSRFKK